MKNVFLTVLLSLILFSNFNFADGGYELWLKYKLVSDKHQYRDLIKGVIIHGNSPTIRIAEKELHKGLDGLLDLKIPEVKNVDKDVVILAGIYKNIFLLKNLDPNTRLMKAGNEGFVIFDANVNGKKAIVITANTDIEILYGVYNFLRLLQTQQNITSLNIISYPKTKLRMLNFQQEADQSGKTLWDALCYHYSKGVEGVANIQKSWDSLKGKIDGKEFNSEQMLLKLQYENAIKWRDGCVLYFQTFSKLPIPSGLPVPEHDLKYYEAHNPR